MTENLKILLVDDVEAERLLIRTALSRAQGVYRFEIVEAETMAAGCGIKSYGPRFALNEGRALKEERMGKDNIDRGVENQVKAPPLPF